MDNEELVELSKKLRLLTGIGLLDARFILERVNYDFDLAIIEARKINKTKLIDYGK